LPTGNIGIANLDAVPEIVYSIMPCVDPSSVMAFTDICKSGMESKKFSMKARKFCEPFTRKSRSGHSNSTSAVKFCKMLLLIWSFRSPPNDLQATNDKLCARCSIRLDPFGEPPPFLGRTH